MRALKLATVTEFAILKSKGVFVKISLNYLIALIYLKSCMIPLLKEFIRVLFIQELLITLRKWFKRSYLNF